VLKLYCALFGWIFSLTRKFLIAELLPINENDDPSSFFIHNCTMGEIHGGGHFHEGIDIDCSTGVNIRSIDDGTVLLAQGDVVEIGHNFDGYVYQQRSFYRHLISINVNNNQGVISGSTIIGKASNHLHLEMKFWNENEYVIVNPVSNNSGWQLNWPEGHPDTYPPQINDILVEALNNQTNNVPSGFAARPTNNHPGILPFHNNYLKAHISSTQYSTLSTGSVYNYPTEKIIVWGNVGFTVNTRDVGVNTAPGPGTSSGEGLTVKNIAFSYVNRNGNIFQKYIVDFSEMLDAESTQIGQLFHIPYFTEQLPDHYLYGNHDFLELRSFDNTYLHIHRPINGIQSNGIWFTKALNTTTHIFNQTPLQIALVNELSLYSDGEQTLNFRVTDASGQEDPYDLRLIVDNFIPCIRKVEIYKYDNPTIAEYERSWELQGNQYVLEEEPVCSFSDDDDIWVLVYSSEPLKYVDFALNSFNDHNTQSSDTEGTQWLFYVSSDNIIPGDNNLLIDGIDYAENKISGNPAVLSVHQINGTWLPTAVEGPDSFHSFNTDISSGPPTIDFEADNTFPDPAELVTLTSYSQSGDLSYEWSFEQNSNISIFYGNGYNQNSPNPVVCFIGANNGNITVSLTVTNEYGSATETKEDYIQLANSSSNPAYPEFSTVNGLTAISAGHSIDFLDLSVNEPTSWFWQFEGGSPEYSSIQNPGGIYYSEPGFYDVSLTVSNGVGSVLTLKKENYITVYEMLEVLNTDCWVDENIISLGEPVQFSATVFNGIPPYSYTINFNDEHIYSFTTDNVIITTDPYAFTSSGNKTISVGITDAGSPPKIGSCYHNISVSQTGPIHTVDFAWNPLNPLLSQDISFQNLSTVPAGMSLNNSYWQWFADPVTGNEPVYPSPVPYSELLYNVNAMNNPSTHAKYGEIGSYPVTLTVSDQYGWQVMKTKYINFSEGIRCVYFDDPGIGVSLKPVVPTNQNVSFTAFAGCCSNAGCAYYDYLKEITDIRWKLFNASTGEYIVNSEVHKSNPATCWDLS